MKSLELILFQKKLKFHLLIWDLKPFMMKILQISKDNNCIRHNFSSEKQEFQFHLVMSSILKKFNKINNWWMNSNFTEKSLKKVKELKLQMMAAKTNISSGLWNLIWIKKCLILKKCNSKYKNRERTKEVEN